MFPTVLSTHTHTHIYIYIYIHIYIHAFMINVYETQISQLVDVSYYSSTEGN